MKFIPIVGTALCVVSCAHLSPEGQKVRVTVNPDVVHGCEFVGNVKAGSGWGGAMASNAGEDQVQVKMQNVTAKLGGNVLFLTSSKGGQSGARGIGEAYKCPPK